jgi:hypothetical protein
VIDGGGVYSILQFQIEKGCDGTKRCQKMKWMQRARLGSMGRKCDTTWRRGDIDRRRGGTEEGKGRRQANANLTGLKMKKIHAIDSAATNRR